MKKFFLLLTLLFSVLVLSSCSLFGIRIDEEHFPAPALRNALYELDSNKNGYLSKKELEAPTHLNVWDYCDDLSGIEYLTNLESINLLDGCSDLSGIEHLTNLKSLSFSDQCPDLSSIECLTDLEEIAVHCCAFSEEFVFDKEVSVSKITFDGCVFEKGIVFDNDNVENVTFEDCGVSGDLIFADCDGLVSFYAYFDTDDLDFDKDYAYLKEQNYSIDLSGCDNLDHVSIDSGLSLSSVDLGNCCMLRYVYICDLYSNNEEITLNICGSTSINHLNLLSTGFKVIDISDCPYLIAASEQTSSEDEYHIEYESEDGHIYVANAQCELIK